MWLIPSHIMTNQRPPSMRKAARVEHCDKISSSQSDKTIRDNREIKVRDLYGIAVSSLTYSR